MLNESDRLDVPHDCSVELSQKGYQFFTDIFELFDKVRSNKESKSLSLTVKQDQDGALNKAELTELFITSPGNPWVNQGFPDTTIASESGAVTLQGWLAQWRCAKRFQSVN